MSGIPRWASARAYDRSLGSVLNPDNPPTDVNKEKVILSTVIGKALAEMIAKYEEPPVDSDEVVVNEIINAWRCTHISLEERKKHWPTLFGRTVERYKKLKETKGES